MAPIIMHDNSSNIIGRTFPCLLNGPGASPLLLRWHDLPRHHNFCPFLKTNIDDVDFDWQQIQGVIEHKGATSTTSSRMTIKMWAMRNYGQGALASA